MIRLFRELSDFIFTAGMSSRRACCAALGISQATFSRLVKKKTGDILVVGKGRSTRYALKNKLTGIGETIPLYEIDEKGVVHHKATLHSLAPKGLYLEDVAGHGQGRYFADLPYFLEDARPQGFLGKLIPTRFPELEVPKDVDHWNATHCLQYFFHHGSDLIGNLILGDEAFKQYLQEIKKPRDVVTRKNRKKHYPKLAHAILTEAPILSSVAGEQPKFLAVRTDKKIKTPVMVKFTPNLSNSMGKRWADLFVCEHIAHQVLKKQHIASLNSEIIFSGGRLFLEVERFDRVGIKGRKGLISLFALDVEYAGSLSSWTALASLLERQHILTHEVLQTIRWLDIFGALIANSDRHGGNLSFFSKSWQPVALAPVYDMLPMLYRPQNDQLVKQVFSSPLPKPTEAALWRTARTAAIDFWTRVQKDKRITKGFKKIAQDNAKTLKDLKEFEKMLP